MDRNKNRIGNASKKGQVTMFMIIGIVLVIGASFLFYFNSKNADKVTKGSTLNTDEFENYINTCLKNSLKKNLIQIGLQGGRLYKSQNGLMQDFDKSQAGSFYILNDGEKVPYLIDKPYGKEGDGNENYQSNAPGYPWINFPMRSGVATYTGYFGINRMPPLKKPQNYSIEEELESATLADVNACNLQSFENIYEITVKAPTLKISLNNSVVAKLNYPITIKDVKTGAKKDFTTFTQEVPTRLKDMFYFAADMIQNDVQNITYDISTATTNEFIVFIKRNASNYNDLIIITDKTSKIDGKQYKFQFARRNRLPAIEKLDKLTLTKGTDIWNIISQIKTQDPDEDKVSVIVEGFDQGHIVVDSDCTGIQVNITDGQYQDYEIFSTSKGNLICN